MAKNKGQNGTNTQGEQTMPFPTETTGQPGTNQQNRPNNKKNPSPQNKGGSNAR